MKQNGPPPTHTHHRHPAAHPLWTTRASIDINTLYPRRSYVGIGYSIGISSPAPHTLSLSRSSLGRIFTIAAQDPLTHTVIPRLNAACRRAARSPCGYGSISGKVNDLFFVRVVVRGVKYCGGRAVSIGMCVVAATGPSSDECQAQRGSSLSRGRIFIDINSLRLCCSLEIELAASTTMEIEMTTYWNRSLHA